MRKSIRIYDNGGKTADRYTAVDMAAPERQAGTYAAIGSSADPYHPQGIGQHCTAMPGAHLGRRIKLEDLPAKVRQFVEDFAG